MKVDAGKSLSGHRSSMFAHTYTRRHLTKKPSMSQECLSRPELRLAMGGQLRLTSRQGLPATTTGDGRVRRRAGAKT